MQIKKLKILGIVYISNKEKLLSTMQNLQATKIHNTLFART